MKFRKFIGFLFIVMLYCLVSACKNEVHIGKYVHMSNQNKYVELTSDGKFFTDEIGGKYTINGVTIIFEGPNGHIERGELIAQGLKIEKEGKHTVLTEGVYSKFLAEQIRNNVPEERRARQH